MENSVKDMTTGLDRVTGKITFDGASVFQAMRSGFERARREHPDSFGEFFYTFAGQRVCMRIVGGDFARHITLPFSHLQCGPTGSLDPQLTIDLWDENETGISCRADGSNGDAAFEWTETTGTSPDTRFVAQRLPNTLACLDRITKYIVGSIKWGDHIFIYERAKPLARLLLEWHNDRGIQIIHGSLISRNGKGVLFVGKSGSGKSTAALACVCHGFNYLSEDYVGLERLAEGSFTGHSLYNSVFLKSDHLLRFPRLLPYAINGRPPQEEKSVVVLSQVFPERLERAVAIHAVLIPRLVGTSKPCIYPAPKGQALLSLGPSSLLQIPSRGTQGFQKLTQLIERVPCYWLDLGGELELIPRCIEAFMACAVRP